MQLIIHSITSTMAEISRRCSSAMARDYSLKEDKRNTKILQIFYHYHRCRDSFVRILAVKYDKDKYGVSDAWLNWLKPRSVNDDVLVVQSMVYYFMHPRILGMYVSLHLT